MPTQSTTSPTDEILARLIERVERRHFGKFRGLVSNNKDPENLGRIKAKVPGLLGDVETGWALPAFPYGGAKDQGFFAIPDVQAGVWVEFEGGDLSYPVWTGTWLASGWAPESASPDQKVLKTKKGHKIVMDDSAGTLNISDSNGNSITMDSNGITLTNGSKSIKLTSSGVSINDGALEVS
jgi:hypothetical protein